MTGCVCVILYLKKGFNGAWVIDGEAEGNTGTEGKETSFFPILRSQLKRDYTYTFI